MKILVIGRFQPFHNGHLHLIQEALKKSNILEDNSIKIAVGSIQESFTKKNPFTFYERQEMLKKSLNKNKINNFSIFGLEDKNSDSVWVKELKTRAGNFDMCYTNNERIIAIFLKNRISIKKIGPFKRKDVSGTIIRKLIAEDKDVKSLLPNETIRVLKKIDGFKRIINIEKTKNKRLFTVGHSTRDIKDFVTLLDHYGIKQVVDVRSTPESRHNPQFNKNTLEKELPENKIDYKNLKDLGGRRKINENSVNDFWKNNSFKGFADYMQTEKFEKGIKQLKKLVSKRRTAVMCAEILPWRCHRSLISDYMTAEGFSVTHIINQNQTKEHEINQHAKKYKDYLVYRQ
jgi:nicotinamide-nucleotide adenylyltransferase